jgi:tetratricopeptide (TPR) repeat protein
MLPKSRAVLSLIAMLTALVGLGACRSVPELRLAGDIASPAGLAEGRRLLEAGRAVEAVGAFRRYLRENGADLSGLNALAITYAELGRSDLAAEMFGRALALKPDDPATLNNIGFAALRRADGKLARRYLERARQASNELAEIEGNIERLLLLEMIEHARSRTPVFRQAAWHGPDQQPSAIIHLSTGRSRSPSSSSGPKETATPSPPQPVLIDFMTVNDPFQPSSVSK